jgi:exonuclease III
MQVTSQVTTDLHNLAHLTFSSQNCNSLNRSTNCPKQTKKIAAILALQTTFIFLSDLRLNTNNYGFNNLFSPRYDMYHNSTSNKRGVGILIARSLTYTIIQSFTDNKNNVLALRLRLGDSDIILISIYGPNNNYKDFFHFIRSVLINNRNTLVICAGDWNTIYSTDPSEVNIDTINMNSPPSPIRSAWLSELCEDFNLSDPFRAKYPYKQEFTYISRSGTRNRSRLDFFIISDRLLYVCNKCDISLSLQTELFDHKNIYMSFCTNRKPSNHHINPSIFTHCRY